MLVWMLYSLMTLNFCAAESAEPFWKAKEKFYERVRGGEVLVSVKSERESAGPNKHKMFIHGGGHVRASAPFVLKTALDFQKVAELSGYIEKTEFDPATQRLTMKIAAYGHRAEMDVQLKVNRDREPLSLDYEVLRGPIKGLRGAFTFASLGSAQSEVGMTGEYRYDILPIPRIFLEFGMEVIFKKMALRLRQFVESEFAKKGEQVI